MNLKIKIIDNKVYLIKFFFFKYPIGVYDNGILLINNSNLIEKLSKNNKKTIGIFRKIF